MKGVMDFVSKNQSCFYFTFRVLVGLLFLQHGAQKLFGVLGGQQVEIMSLMGLVGTIEFLGGLLIAVGLFTQVAALFGALDMLGAWLMVHLPQGVIPILNGGELAALFFASFLVLIAYGAGKWGLGEVIFKR